MKMRGSPVAVKTSLQPSNGSRRTIRASRRSSLWAIPPEAYTYRRSFSHSNLGDLRSSIVSGTNQGLHLSGVILLATPFDFRSSHSGRTETLKSYFGERIAEDCPLVLLKSFAFHGPGEHAAQKPRLYVLRATLDSEDEIIQPTIRFVTAWKEEQHAAALDEGVLEWHNHLSPCFALWTNLANEEEWGLHGRKVDQRSGGHSSGIVRKTL